jgi:hypothetical protein
LSAASQRDPGEVDQQVFLDAVGFGVGHLPIVVW